MISIPKFTNEERLLAIKLLHQRIAIFTVAQTLLIVSITFFITHLYFAYPEGVILYGYISVLVTANFVAAAFFDYNIHRAGKTLSLLNDPLEAIKSLWLFNSSFILLVNTLVFLCSIYIWVMTLMWFAQRDSTYFYVSIAFVLSGGVIFFVSQRLALYGWRVISQTNVKNDTQK